MKVWFVLCVLDLAFTVILGCSSAKSLPETSKEKIMVEQNHEHYHVHGKGIVHDHSHSKSQLGGHSHTHAHTAHAD